MNRDQIIKTFNPNNVGLKNGHFIGLPFDEKNAQIILFPVNWDVTVSYNDGTSTGPDNILAASGQLDLEDSDVKDAWKIGIFMKKPSQKCFRESEKNRKKALKYIEKLESGETPEKNSAMLKILQEVNQSCNELNFWVEKKTVKLLDKGKLVGLIGGDHSTPLGYIKALASRHEEFGILTIDAHMDQRKAYEGFIYSHASIFYNVIHEVKQVKNIVHAGIRDFCEEERILAESNERINVFYDHDIKQRQFEGEKFKAIVKDIIDKLPQKVYISFDIDGLRPNLCPHTGTPVPGGFEFEEAVYILRSLVHSGRTIIGFDLCETAALGNEWDGNVAARLAYKLSNLMGKSNHISQ